MHGIAIAPEVGRGFVSNGQASTVTIFDLKTLKAIGDVATGQKPDAIIYDPATSRVFAFNGGSNSATAIRRCGRKSGGHDRSWRLDPSSRPRTANWICFNNLEDESLVLKMNAQSN